MSLSESHPVEWTPVVFLTDRVHCNVEYVIPPSLRLLRVARAALHSGGGAAAEAGGGSHARRQPQILRVCAGLRRDVACSALQEPRQPPRPEDVSAAVLRWRLIW